MKVRAILKKDKLIFQKFTVINKPEVQVDVEISDKDIKIYTEEELEKMPLTELAHLIWDNVEIDKKEINRDYKELLAEALEEKYK